MPYTADCGITRAMPPQLAVAKRRVRRMELKLHQVRHEAALLRQYLEGAVGPNEAILLKRHLTELDARGQDGIKGGEQLSATLPGATPAKNESRSDAS